MGILPGDRVPPFGTLRAFEAAARHLSFKKAAQELFVTPSAVSQQIRMLEEHVGVPLFKRLTRAIQLTPEGEAMLPKIRDGLGALSAALRTLLADASLKERLGAAARKHCAERFSYERMLDRMEAIYRKAADAHR